MTRITIKLTIKELEMLTGLAADQLFRKEFIDPKLPGHWNNVGDIAAGKALVARLRSSLVSGPRKGLARARNTG
jgi:hypothetical protein